MTFSHEFFWYLTNKEAPIACALFCCKAPGSGYSTKEAYREARADRLKHQTSRNFLDRKFEPYKKKTQYSVCQKKKEKQRIWIIKFYSWTIPKKKWETCHFCGWWRELSFVPCYLLLQRILFKLMRASVIQKLYYKLCFRFCLIFWIFDCSVLRRKRTCKSLNVFYNQFTSSWYDWAKNKINPS